MKRVAIVGGGAAGMMAAVAAAKNGAQVTLYEKNDRVGKKILATGNGKCNFSNRDFSAAHYYGNERKGLDVHRMEVFFRQFSVEDTLDFFGQAGMLVKEKNGCLYPRSEQASTVLDVLRLELKRQRVTVRTSADVREVMAEKGSERQGSREPAGQTYGKRRRKGREAGGFLLRPFEEDGSYQAVVIACGGCAAPKTGSDGSGFRLAEQLGHRIVPAVPALVQLRCREEFLKTVAGVRCEAGVTLYAGRGNGAGGPGKEKTKIQEEAGELQFTDYGISGIPVFQLSRQAAYLLKEKMPAEARIDFFPYITRGEFETICRKRLADSPGKNLEEFLLGMANKKVNQLMLKLAGLKPEEKTEAAGEGRLRQLLSSYRGLRLQVTAANSFGQAQVTAGGVDLAEVSDRLGSVKRPGVFFAGEVLDVDGRCGGYNLQWAWTSGYIAGKNAALAE